MVTWNMELASPSALARNGWTSRTLKVGDQVTVTGYAAKVAQYRGDARSVIRPTAGRSSVARPMTAVRTAGRGNSHAPLG
jgi:hypothetical protein